MRRPLLSITVAATVLLALAGCASSAYPAFDRPATEKDALPSDLEWDSVYTEGIDPGSTRFAGSYENVDFYIIRRDDGICLAAAAGDSSSISCGDGGGIDVSSPGVYRAQLIPEVARDGEGWLAISENVRVKPNP